MKLISACGALFVLSVFSFSVQAQMDEDISPYKLINAHKTNVYTEDYNKCMDNSGGVTADMLDCIANEYDYWDKELNSAYANAINSCDAYYAQDSVKQKECKANLTNMERNWIKYRDLVNNLPLDVFAEGEGSFSAITVNSRMLEMVKDQTLLLQSLSYEPK